MAWKKSLPMTWAWQQQIVNVSDVATTLAALANKKWLIKHVIGLHSANGLERILIVSCQGTKIVKAKKPKPVEPETEEV